MFVDVTILSVFVAFLVIFLNYCFGKPGSEKFSPYEIFSFYTVWLSKRRLKQVGLLSTYESQYEENEERAKKKSDLISLKNDYNKIFYEAAEPFFTWERAAGMCPICFGVWVAIICWNVFIAIFNYHGFTLVYNFVFLLIVIIISHVIIRLLTKII